MIREQGEIDPKEVWGQYFRVPRIEGLGSGAGFGFQDLKLPRRWEEAVETLNHPHFRYCFEKFANNTAGRFGLTIRIISWDEKTGILSNLSIAEGQACGIYLELQYPEADRAEYHGHNVDSLVQAHCLFSIVARFINEVLDRIYGTGR